MATRFYLPASGAAPVTPPTLTGWTAGTTAHYAAPTSTSKTNTAFADFTVAEILAANFNVPIGAFVSDALDAQSIAGNVTAVVRGFESLSGADDSLQVGVYLIAGDGSAIKQTLYGGHAAALQLPTNVGVLGQEFDGTAETRIIPSTAMTTQAADAGDRLMIVIGYRAHGASTGTGRSATLRLGDPTGTADFALTADLTSDLCPWVELSADVTFDSGDSPVTGTGALTGPAGALAGTGTVSVAGTGALTGPAGALAGTGTTLDRIVRRPNTGTVTRPDTGIVTRP